MSRLQDKRQEWEAVTALEEMTGDIAKSLRDISARGNIMADGGVGKPVGASGLKALALILSSQRSRPL